MRHAVFRRAMCLGPIRVGLGRAKRNRLAGILGNNLSVQRCGQFRVLQDGTDVLTDTGEEGFLFCAGTKQQHTCKEATNHGFFVKTLLLDHGPAHFSFKHPLPRTAVGSIFCLGWRLRRCTDTPVQRRLATQRHNHL